MLCSFRQDPEVADWVRLLKQRYTGLKLIVGRDKLDEVQVCIICSILLCSTEGF